MGLILFYIFCAVVFFTDPQNKEIINKCKNIEE